MAHAREIGFIIAKNYRVLKHTCFLPEPCAGFIIAKNYRVLKPSHGHVQLTMRFIIAKNYRVLKRVAQSLYFA